MTAVLKVAALLLATGLLQTLLTGLWAPFGLFDPLMVATGLLALRLPFVPAVLSGAAAGLIQDSLSGGLVGLHAFAKTAVCAVLTSMGKVIVVRGELARALVVGLGAIGEGAIVWLLQTFLSWPGGEPGLWIVGRGGGTAVLCGLFLIGVPRVVMAFRRWRRRPAIRLR